MATSTPPRGRLIDHIMLVVRDLAASRNFYEAVLGSLGIPLGGEGDDCFWAEELFVCREGSTAALGHPGGPHHLAFRANQREQVDNVHAIALVHGATSARRANIRSTPNITPASCWTRTATTSKSSATAPR